MKNSETNLFLQRQEGQATSPDIQNHERDSHSLYIGCTAHLAVRDAKPTGKNFCWKMSNSGILGCMRMVWRGCWGGQGAVCV